MGAAVCVRWIRQFVSEERDGADSYNEGPSGVSSRLKSGQNPDSGTTGQNYGNNIMGLMNCFQ